MSETETPQASVVGSITGYGEAISTPAPAKVSEVAELIEDIDPEDDEETLDDDDSEDD